jgi:hypothetical protein
MEEKQKIPRRAAKALEFLHRAEHHWGSRDEQMANIVRKLVKTTFRDTTQGLRLCYKNLQRHLQSQKFVLLYALSLAFENQEKQDQRAFASYTNVHGDVHMLSIQGILIRLFRQMMLQKGCFPSVR